jgi:CYTH domain-containing protein
MKYEIERKFLVKMDKWGVLVRPEGHLYVQGYLTTEPDKTIRVRIADSKGYITLKGMTVGAKRLEYEYEIPEDDAKEILDNFTNNPVAKIRYEINFKGKVWVVDEFIDKNFGLIVAEIELSSEDEKFELPDWVGKEVTDDARYFNSNLSVLPFNKW